MLAACFAIIMVVFISSFMCIRTKHNKLGYSILPIALVPSGHMLGGQIILKLYNGLKFNPTAAMSIVTAVDVAALVAGIAIIIVYSRSCFKRKATKRFYCTALAGFMSILTLVLLLNFYRDLI